MKLHIVISSQLPAVASSFISDSLAEKSGVLGVATGSTFTPIYSKLAQNLPKSLQLIGLDEYLGISPDHPSSFRQTLMRELLTPAGIPGTNLLMPSASGRAEDIANFERELQRHGPVKLQLLGIGTNGHIAFNEPGSDPRSRTRVVSLTEETIAANSGNFEGEIPKQAITQGIANILEAESILLVAFGEKKAEAISMMVSAESQSPAASLVDHKQLTVMIDKQAASKLSDNQIKQFSE